MAYTPITPKLKKEVHYPESDSELRQILQKDLRKEKAARRAAEKRVRVLEEELARLRRERS